MECLLVSKEGRTHKVVEHEKPTLIAFSLVPDILLLMASLIDMLSFIPNLKLDG